MLLPSTLITSGFIDIVMVIQHLFCIEISISTIMMIPMENQYLFNVGLLSGRIQWRTQMHGSGIKDKGKWFIAPRTMQATAQVQQAGKRGR